MLTFETDMRNIHVSCMLQTHKNIQMDYSLRGEFFKENVIIFMLH